jgi:hypothetical protein
VAGKPGRRRVCRWNRNQPSTETFKPFQPFNRFMESALSPSNGSNRQDA